MALKKEVYRRQATGEALWSTTKKKLQNSTDFVKTQQSELFQIFKNYKTGTKVVAISVVLNVLPVKSWKWCIQTKKYILTMRADPAEAAC